MNATDPHSLSLLRTQVERIQAELAGILKRIEHLESEAAGGSSVAASSHPSLPEAPAPLAQSPQPVTSGPKPPPLPAAALENNLSAPQKTERAADVGDPGWRGTLEMRIGVTWLVRLGMLMLLTALVYAGWYTWDHLRLTLGPVARVTGLYAASAVLLGLGWAIFKTQGANLRTFAQVIFAGGLAALYYVTYAAHHVEALRVIASPALASLLLAAVAFLIVWTAIRWESPALAAAAFALAFYTSVISGVTWFSLASHIILALAASALHVRRGWSFLSLVALLGTYGTYIYWRISQNPIAATDTPALGVLTTYWVLFTIGAAWPMRPGERGYARSALAVANGALWAGSAGAILDRMMPEHLWLAFTVMGGLHFAIAAFLARHEPSQTLRAVFFLTGAAFFTFAILVKFSGEILALILAAETLALAATGALRDSRGARLASVLVSFVALCALAAEKPAMSATIGCATFMVAASLSAGLVRSLPTQNSRWDESLLAIASALALLILPGAFDIPWQRALSLMLSGLFLAALPAVTSRRSFITASALPFAAAAVHLLESNPKETNALVEALYPATLFIASVLTCLRGHSRAPLLCAGMARGVMLGIAIISTIIFVFRWVEPRWQLAFLFVLAALALDRSVVSRQKWTLFAGALFLLCALFALLEFSAGALRASIASGFTLALVGAQARRLGNAALEHSNRGQRINGLLLLVALLWVVWLSRFATANYGGDALTAAWAIAGFVCLAVGLSVREPVLRLSGLATLALALGRAVIYDVWTLGLGQRLIVFVVLGVVLTVAGFIYNRISAHDPGQNYGTREQDKKE